MDRMSSTFRTRVIGPAVIGHDPEQYLCWKPCCHEPVRLNGDEVEHWRPVVVPCTGPRCDRLWTVEFPRQAPGAEATAVWRCADAPPEGASSTSDTA